MPLPLGPRRRERFAWGQLEGQGLEHDPPAANAGEVGGGERSASALIVDDPAVVGQAARRHQLDRGPQAGERAQSLGEGALEIVRPVRDLAQ